MKIAVKNETEVYQTFRSNRVRSLFNVEDERGARFELDVELPELEGVGLVVGPSGSGKSSIGRELVAAGTARWWNPKWPKDRPIIEAIAAKAEMDVATGALASVGLGDVPSWLRPYGVLSQGEQFRASLAKLCAEAKAGETWIVDEFTSVVDRQIAKVGSMAFSKTARRTGANVVLLSCHHDIIEWLVPDWCYDTGTGELTFPKAQGSSAQRLTSKSEKSGGDTGRYSSLITI